MKELEDYWKRVNKLIKQTKRTQKSLSLECGFSERRIESLATPYRSPDILESVKIAEVLGTSVEYLVTGNHPTSYQLESALDKMQLVINEFRKN